MCSRSLGKAHIETVTAGVLDVEAMTHEGTDEQRTLSAKAKCSGRISPALIHSAGQRDTLSTMDMNRYHIWGFQQGGSALPS